jgi:hypothetical protein
MLKLCENLIHSDLLLLFLWQSQSMILVLVEECADEAMY